MNNTVRHNYSDMDRAIIGIIKKFTTGDGKSPVCVHGVVCTQLNTKQLRGEIVLPMNALHSIAKTTSRRLQSLKRRGYIERKRGWFIKGWALTDKGRQYK